MTGEHRLLSASPRRIGALGSTIIASNSSLHLSLNRWFSRPVHSDEGSNWAPSEPKIYEHSTG
jgi:hypothetical protein